MLTRNNPCTISAFASNDRVALHECDATFGDSGSPMLLERDGSFRIVAMLVGIDNRTGNGVAVTGKAFHDRLQNLGEPQALDEPVKACQSPFTETVSDEAT